MSKKFLQTSSMLTLIGISFVSFSAKAMDSDDLTWTQHVKTGFSRLYVNWQHDGFNPEDVAQAIVNSMQEKTRELSNRIDQQNEGIANLSRRLNALEENHSASQQHIERMYDNLSNPFLGTQNKLKKDWVFEQNSPYEFTTEGLKAKGFSFNLDFNDGQLLNRGGKEIIISVWMKTSLRTVYRLQIAERNEASWNCSYSPYHSGSNQWEKLETRLQLRQNPKEVYVRFIQAGHNNSGHRPEDGIVEITGPRFQCM